MVFTTFIPQTKQVCVQLPTSADKVTLLAFAAVRRAAAALGGRRYQSISPARLAHNSNPPHRIQRSIDGTDGPTDGRAPYRHIDPAEHYADTVSNNLTIIMFIKTLELIQITLLPLNFMHL